MKNLKLKSSPSIKELSIYNSDNILNALSSSSKYIGTLTWIPAVLITMQFICSTFIVLGLDDP